MAPTLPTNNPRLIAAKAGQIPVGYALVSKWFVRLLQCLLLALLCGSSANAQPYANLKEVKGYSSQVYYSVDTDAKAQRMAVQLDKVMDFYEQHLNFRPQVTLLILSPEDWDRYTKFPFYGMPHYQKNTLIVAASDNAYWKSMVPDSAKMPNAHRQAVNRAYANKKGGLTMEPFFDLLAIHELGHAYQHQGGLVMQRKWMSELFCNVLLHGYIVENEPALLPALTTFPKLVVATTEPSTLKYTTLEQLEANYNEIGANYPENYGWYQCRWHIAAGEIYDTGRMEGVKRLWNAFTAQQSKLNDVELRAFLKLAHKSIDVMMEKWNH